MTDQFFEDQNLNCRDCKQPFVFTGGEQRFFTERGFTPPTRCKACRVARKAQKDQDGGGSFVAPAAPPPVEVLTRGRYTAPEPVYGAPPSGKPVSKKQRGGGGSGRRNWDGYDD